MRRLRFVQVLGIMACCAVALAAGPGLAATLNAALDGTPGRLTGKLLIAAPSMQDPRFAGSVVLMINHNAGGAMGIVINRLLGTVPAARLAERLKLPGITGTVGIGVHYGGPVEPGRGFLVHSGDYAIDGTIAVTDDIRVTQETRSLRAALTGKAPRSWLFALGYAGWGPGQLESELARKAWSVVPADAALVFDTDLDAKREKALRRRGTDL
jgi:putative transcriptional regulator